MQTGVDLIGEEVWRTQAWSVGEVIGGGEHFAAPDIEVRETFWCDVCWEG